VLTRQEKERLVIELYNQGKTIRDIAKELRISFRDIGAILKKASGEREEKQDIKESLSPSTKAYHLFSKGKTPIEVAIALNLSEVETTKFYEEFWHLKQMHELTMVYDEIGDDIMHFLKLYRLSKDAHMNPEHVVNLLQISNDYLPLLEHRYKRLTKEMDSMELEKQRLRDLGNQVRTLTKVSEKCKGEVKNLQKEKTKLSTLIAKFENCNEYKKIRQAAEEEVTNSLSKRKDLLKLAASSVIESITKDPTKYNFLINSSIYNGGQPYIDMYRALILDEAQRIFELMVRDLTNTIVGNAALTITS
jgi:predicted transcriptional regulator